MSAPKTDRIMNRPAQADEDCIRVRLDHRTIVLVKSLKSLERWKLRYPGATVIDVAGTVSKVNEGTGPV